MTNSFKFRQLFPGTLFVVEEGLALILLIWEEMRACNRVEYEANVSIAKIEEEGKKDNRMK